MSADSKDEALLCLEQVRRFDHDRFLTLAFAPADKQQALAALYAFNAEIARIPSLVSEPMLGQIRLQWWRDTLEALERGEAGGHFVSIALSRAREEYPISLVRLQQLIDARERDLDETPFADLASLEIYGDATTYPLMAAAIEILEGEVHACAQALHQASIAHALTGLLRGVGSHAAQGRVLLPADALATHNVDPHDILAGKMTAGLRAVMKELIAAVRHHLDLARKERIPRKILPVFLPVSFCDTYLSKMGIDDFDVFRMNTESPAFKRQLRLFSRNFAGKF